ncbi:type II secretion system protein GspC [Halopseudomonas aestusnigri]|uniref:General secretion pathway protein C n=1 Tax=Halopseudomonas aestusnigri TaxID=857252 RepID=A0AAQ1JQZ7_9GAMM|nr:type II secretion system protein GspC [Halopseudomonas aestusnigri]SEG59793.1 general secretion pathway protein C [Halopseudomonas aestusnigri]
MPQVARLSLENLVTLVCGVFVLVAAWLLGRLVWVLIEPQSVLPAVDPVPYSVSASELTTTRPGFRELAMLSPYGQADRAPVVVNAPDTKLSWTLKGVLADPDPARSAAILVTQGQPEKLYRVGATLPGQVRLEQVLGDRVMLMRDGQLETLRLKRNDLAGNGRPSRSAGRASALPEVDSSQTLAPDGGLARIDREAWLNDPQRFADVISANPVMVDGSLYGIEVSPARNAREFEAAGLQAGDVITDVDGTPVSQIEDYREILGQMSGASSVSVSLERDGQPMNITITMD